MPLDLDGLALIDTMLDAVIELRLLAFAWSTEADEDISSIHEALLHLNRIWQELDDDEYVVNASFELRTPMNSIIGFTRVLQSGIDGPMPDIALPYLNKIETLAMLILGKINYFINKYRARY